MAIPFASTIMSFLGGAAASGSSGPITNTVNYTVNSLMPIVMPDYPELANSFALGDMPAATFRELSLVHGKQFGSLDGLFNYTKLEDGRVNTNFANTSLGRSPNARVLQTGTWMPSLDETRQLLNRDAITQSLATYISERQTTFNPDLAKAMMDLRFEIPGPADLVRFAVRDCFTPEVVSQFEYAKETPIEIKPWMIKQGYGQSIGLQLPANATDASNTPLNGDASWFDLFWWSHWDLPSPTQGYEMLYRLYPNSDFGPSPFVTDTNKFEQADLELLLKASDYPQYWRERLIAISYHNLNRSDVIPMYERGIVEKPVVYHALRADGYRDVEAKQLLDLADLRKQQYLGINTRKQARTWVCQMYSTGQLLYDDAKARLQANGYNALNADWFLQECDLRASYEANKQYIAALKSGYIKGILTEDNVTDQLHLNNFRPDWIERTIGLWTTLKNGKYKQLSALKNIKAYNLGLINRNEIIARLQNLQYEPTAITTMIGLADYDIAQRQLKRVQQQLVQQQKAAKQALIEQNKATKAAQQAAKKVQSNIEMVNKKRVRQLIVAMNDKNIIQFWKKKTVYLWEIFYRLYYRDFNILDARKWVVAWIDGPKEEELVNAETQAQKVYRSEPNPPLV